MISLPISTRKTRARFVGLAACVVVASSLAACGSPTGSGSTTPAAPVAAAPVAASVADTKCNDGANQVASIAPGSITTDPTTMSDSETYNRIKKDKRLVVGTSADVLLWGSRDPKTGSLQGFDIDVLKEVAGALGVPITYKVITYAQRLPSLADGSVDLVAHTMTINCARWQGPPTGADLSDPKYAGAKNAINFSSEYYAAGQRVLVRSDSSAKTIQALKGQKVCVPAGSTNVAAVQNMGLDLVQEDVIGDCLVQFQEGEVAAITGDDTVLAGFAAQDPYALLVGPKFTEEPYGLGINADDVQFTQFVNAVLEKLRSNGRLAEIYRETMGTAVKGAAPAIPQPVYGRDISKLQRKSS